MALEQKLHLKLSQKLIMTPSLQQAIKLLQLSKLELQEVLNQELLENPLLEETAEEQKAEETPAEEAEAKSETEEPPKVETKEQEKEKPANFAEASRWYGEFLTSFRADPELRDDPPSRVTWWASPVARRRSRTRIRVSTSR